MTDIKIIQKSIADLIPYSRNPRRNDEAVPMVMNSIKEFGFKVPIVVDRNNIIVCGHTRFKAALKLGLETVPCIVADDLSDEQIKAFRLADNKVSEKAEWDFEILSGELDDIINLDMDSFGFESIEFEEPEEDDSEKVNERERTGNTATATNVNTNRTGTTATTEEKRTRAGKLAEGHGQWRISSQCGDGRRSQLQHDRRTDEQRPQGKR